jgi:hypothetical protein
MTQSPPARGTAWIIADASETRFRCWSDYGFAWTMNQRDALWFARREDAEKIAEDDEDAWKILSFKFEYVDPAERR